MAHKIISCRGLSLSIDYEEMQAESLPFVEQVVVCLVFKATEVPLRSESEPANTAKYDRIHLNPLFFIM